MQNLSAKHSRSLIWWEDPTWETFWETIKRTNYSIWFTGRVLPYFCERPVKNPSIWKDSLTWIVPRIRFVRGWNLEGWRDGRRHWGVGNDGRIWNLLEKTQCERGDISQKNKENLFFQSQMDESNPLEEIKTWEHPPWYGNVQFEEKVTLIFLENQKGLFHHLTTRFRMPVKRQMTFGPCQETSYTAITLNPESNFTRREKNHSLFHWNTLTSPELHTRIWMSNKRNASMITGISMGQEIVWSMDKFHSIYSEGKPSKRIYVVRVEINEKTADTQARLFMARTLGENGKECQAEGEAKVVAWKAPSR